MVYVINLTHGVNDFTKRVHVKDLFEQFGEISACWLPPVGHRHQEYGYIKFKREASAQAAVDACNRGQVDLWGRLIGAEIRLGATTNHDDRDFDARGSNLISSRELFKQNMMKRAAGGGGRDRGRGRDRSPDYSDYSQSPVRGRGRRDRDERPREYGDSCAYPRPERTSDRRGDRGRSYRREDYDDPDQFETYRAGGDRERRRGRDEDEPPRRRKRKMAELEDEPDDRDRGPAKALCDRDDDGYDRDRDRSRRNNADKELHRLLGEHKRDNANLMMA